MDALLELLRHRIVALAASRGHVEFEDGRLRILRIQDFVRAVAVGANRGFFRARGDGVSVHALLVRSNHLGALSAVFHDKFLAVAGATGRGDVGVVYARLGIAGRKQFVGAAVAVDAGGGLAVASLNGLRVETALVGRLFVGMAGGAGDSLGGSFVAGALYVGVAVDTGKHAAVNRIFERLGIDMQADRLAVDVVGEGTVAMTGEALVCGGFGRVFAGSVGGPDSYE